LDLFSDPFEFRTERVDAGKSFCGVLISAIFVSAMLAIVVTDGMNIFARSAENITYVEQGTYAYFGDNDIMPKRVTDMFYARNATYFYTSLELDWNEEDKKVMGQVEAKIGYRPINKTLNYYFAKDYTLEKDEDGTLTGNPEKFYISTTRTCSQREKDAIAKDAGIQVDDLQTSYEDQIERFIELKEEYKQAWKDL
jgi:hypothetical protein